MSENQDKRKELLAVLAEHLKPHGFKKKAFTYKRETEKGLWQIVELQLGRSWSSSEGKVRLEFGIFTEEWHQFLNRYKMPATLRTADCEIRDFRSKLVHLEEKEEWNDLSQSQNELVTNLISVIDEAILPFLDLHRTRQSILDSYLKEGEKLGFPPRHELSVAVLHFGMGNLGDAERLLIQEFEKNKNNPFYQEVYSNLTGEIESAETSN